MDGLLSLDVFEAAKKSKFEQLDALPQKNARYSDWKQKETILPVKWEEILSAIPTHATEVHSTFLWSSILVLIYKYY